MVELSGLVAGLASVAQGVGNYKDKFLYGFMIAKWQVVRLFHAQICSAHQNNCIPIYKYIFTR